MVRGYGLAFFKVMVTSTVAFSGSSSGFLPEKSVTVFCSILRMTAGNSFLLPAALTLASIPSASRESVIPVVILIVQSVADRIRMTGCSFFTASPFWLRSAGQYPWRG